MRSLLIAAALLLSAPLGAQDRWEETIQTFEAADRSDAAKAGGVVFIGSSSIRKWELEKSFPGRGYVNRGFGGSVIADAIRYADRIVTPRKPSLVVLYAGDNDIGRGGKARKVLDDYQAFVAKIHAELPQTRIGFIAVKPSLRRWSMIDTIREANALVRAEAGKDPRLFFVDIDAPMLGSDGRPRPELFVEDGLHMTDEGYRVWVEALEPFLGKD